MIHTHHYDFATRLKNLSSLVTAQLIHRFEPITFKHTYFNSSVALADCLSRSCHVVLYSIKALTKEEKTEIHN
jgi:hypothetical protein